MGYVTVRPVISMAVFSIIIMIRPAAAVHGIIVTVKRVHRVFMICIVLIGGNFGIMPVYQLFIHFDQAIQILQQLYSFSVLSGYLVPVYAQKCLFIMIDRVDEDIFFPVCRQHGERGPAYRHFRIMQGKFPQHSSVTRIVQHTNSGNPVGGHRILPGSCPRQICISRRGNPGQGIPAVLAEFVLQRCCLVDVPVIREGEFLQRLQADREVLILQGSLPDRLSFCLRGASLHFWS